MRIDYSSEFLSEFSVIQKPYIYIKEKDKSVEISLMRKNSTKDWRALIRAVEVKNILHQCLVYNCDLFHFESCVGCRCMAGSRKDGKCVIFKVEYIYTVE